MKREALRRIAETGRMSMNTRTFEALRGQMPPAPDGAVPSLPLAGVQIFVLDTLPDGMIAAGSPDDIARDARRAFDEMWREL